MTFFYMTTKKHRSQDRYLFTIAYDLHDTMKQKRRRLYQDGKRQQMHGILYIRFGA